MVLLKNQISMLEQKMAASLHNEHTTKLSPIKVDVCMQTIETKPADMKAHDSEVCVRCSSKHVCLVNLFLITSPKITQYRNLSYSLNCWDQNLLVLH